MKKFNILFLSTLLIFAACQDGYIDDINPVDAGNDENAPAITIGYPSSAVVLIPFTDESTDIDFEFEVRDDIEITSIAIALNGQPLESYQGFLDFRRVKTSFKSENLALGNYKFEVNATDASGKTTTKVHEFEISNIYAAKYPGEIFYMPFEGNVYMDLLGEITAAKIGSPSFGAGKAGRAYAGATDSYLTVPTAGLVGSEFSGSFWYKINASTTHAGLVTVSPPDPSNNKRSSGFRLFREPGASGNQRIKLNVGNGTADVWFDGGTAADISATADWVHIAFTIAPDRCALYINGKVVKDGSFTGVSWADCDAISIASGAPNFTGWNHKSDLSLIDELRFFDKALTAEEVNTIFEDN
ncbi:LamG domain-containing protein [Sphingobacterium corticibacterium]|nr:LamG domain-containing protein [Sphingobacterium corticibacterium]